MSKYKSERIIMDGSEHNLTFHPYNIILVLTLAGITMLFLAITGAYLYNRVQQPSIPPIKVPWLFLFNTLILISSSVTLIRAKKNYLDDDTESYKFNLLITIALTFMFLILQLFAWKNLLLNDILVNYNNLASYLYVLSALHFLHVIAGLPFLIMFYLTARNKMKEPVSVLIYFSDPFKKLKLNILTLYWHFLDILWIYLVIFLFVNQLIK